MKTNFLSLFVAIMMVSIVSIGQPNQDRRTRGSSNQRVDTRSTNATQSRQNQPHRESVNQNSQRRESVNQNSQRRESVNQNSQRRESISRNSPNQKNTQINRSQTSRPVENSVNRDKNINRNDRGRIVRENQKDYVYRNSDRWDIDRRNYGRSDWERRNYNWNDYNWNYSRYYRKNYIPYYFRDNPNYWYYPSYGHILRGFRHNPIIFYSNRNPYYFYDGFFYRYYSGVGYVWIEETNNIWFNELPYNTTRVMIGGHLYFKLGNTYFEFTPLGFRLVVLPDRYY